MAEGTCIIEECDRTGRIRRGLCEKHYWRWRQHGGPANPLRERVLTCTIEDCDRPHWGRGFCNLHWQRWRHYGDPTVVLPRNGPSFSDTPGYKAVHRRLRDSRGPAKNYSCAHCGEPATDWAYDGACPNEETDKSSGLAYSTDPDRYMPLCHPCHCRFDGARRTTGP